MASAPVGLKMVLINIHYSFLTAGDHMAFFTYIDFTSTVHWCHWLAIFPGDILCLLCNCGQWWFTCRLERLEFPLFLVSIMSIFIRLGVADLECLSSLLQVCSASLFFFVNKHWQLQHLQPWLVGFGTSDVVTLTRQWYMELFPCSTTPAWRDWNSSAGDSWTDVICDVFIIFHHLTFF